MYQLILMFHLLIAIGLIVLVFLQQGKGAEIGAAFGSGASQTVFGSQGSGSFIFKLTSLLAIAFFVTSLLLGYVVSNEAKQSRELQFPAPLTKAKTVPMPKAPPSQVPVAPVPNKVDEKQ